MKRFDGKTVYITGGSSGIGLEIGKLLASLGADILLLARNEKKLKDGAGAIEKFS
jgi:short-subunit dehydrogenase